MSWARKAGTKKSIKWQIYGVCDMLFLSDLSKEQERLHKISFPCNVTQIQREKRETLKELHSSTRFWGHFLKDDLEW